MADYVTLDDLRRTLSINGERDDAALQAAITGACAAIDNHCGRTFVDSGAATARLFTAWSTARVVVDDFHTTSGLVVVTDPGDDDTWSTTWTSADYEVGPQSGGNFLGEPYRWLAAVGSYSFPMGGRRTYRVRVTARWGWASVPDPVVTAARLVAHDLFSRRNAPLGVAAGGIEFGGVRVSANTMRSAESLLVPLRRIDRVAGVA